MGARQHFMVFPVRGGADFRRPRTAEVQVGSRANGRRYDSQYDDLGQRDAEIADSGKLRASLYDYDVELRAKEFAAL